MLSNNKGEIMKKLKIMRGLPGSGKSSKAKTLTEASNIFSTDDYWGENYDFDITRLGQAHNWNKMRVLSALKEGREVICVDNTNTTWKEMKPYIRVAIENGYDVEFIESESSWWKGFIASPTREAYNNVFVEKTIHDVPIEAVDRMIARWTDTEVIKEQYENYKKQNA
jgi:predicted kinase